jgi:succinate dehydrogenase/fumarate reductase flavoprotein subunit
MDESATVVVVGFGAAGACAAIEAAESGVDVLIIDRFTGGGATAISGGIVYAGGGTRQQRAAGVIDTPTAMYDYLRHEVRDAVTPATLRRFCDESADMLAWLEDHGVPFDARLCPYKTSYPTNRHYLYQSGSEHGHPAPAPRGHRTHAPGTSGGTLHARLAAAAFARRIRFLPQSQAVTLLLSPTPHTSTPTAPHPHPSTPAPTWPPPPSQPPGDSAESQRDSLGWSSPLSRRPGDSGGNQPGHVGWSSPLSRRAGGSGENQPAPGAGPAASSATRPSPFPRWVADTEVPQSDRVGWSSPLSQRAVYSGGNQPGSAGWLAPLSQTAGDSGGSQPDSDDDRLSSVRAGSGSGVDGLGERVVGVVCRTLRGAPGWARVAHRWLHRWSVKPGVYVPGIGRVLHRAVAWIEERYGRELRIHADAVVLAAGGFVFDREMMREHAPGYRGLRLGTPGDDGAGIRLGTAAGAGTRHLDRVTLWRFLTPPSALLGGVLVDRAGLRVCDESRYGAAIGEAIRACPDGRAWLLVDADVLREAWRQIPSQTLWFQRWQSWWLFTARRTSAATLPELARRAGIDEATLAATVAANNAVAGNAGVAVNPVANNFAPATNAAATNAAATNAAADNAADDAVAVNEAAAEGGAVSVREAAAEGGAASTNDAGAADEGGEAVTDGAVAAGDSVVAADNVVVAAGVADATVDGPARDEVGKPVALVRPLVRAPFSLIDVSLRAVPAPMLTLGGLIVDEETGRVLTPSGASISGLFAAGRTAVGICSGSYVSGLSLADCVFSGRRAGRHAATASAALEVRTSAATPTTEAATPATATTPPTAAAATPASAMATPATPATVAATPTTTTATPTTATAATTPTIASAATPTTATAATTPTIASAATPTIATAAVTPGTPAVTPATATSSDVTATAMTATSPAGTATASGGVAAGESSASVFSGTGPPADSSSTAAAVASSGGRSGSSAVDAASASGGAESGASAAEVESGSESEGTHDQRD